MHHILISYSRADSAQVLPVVQQLRDAGLPVWIDERDIPCSVPWFKEIQSAILASSLVVVFDSPNWRDSPNCAAEAAQAAAVQVPVVYVQLVDSGPNDARRAIMEAVSGLDPDSDARTELRVLCHEWEEQDRPLSGLVGITQMARFRPVYADEAHPATELENAFATASLLKATLGLVGKAVGFVLFTAVTWAGIAILPGPVKGALLSRLETQGSIDAQTLSRVAATTLSADALAGADYAQQAARRPDPVSGFQLDEALVNALANPLPVASTEKEAAQQEPLPRGVLQARSHDGRWVATTQAGGRTLRILNSASGAVYRSIRTAGSVTALAFSPDDRTIACGTAGEVALYSIARGLLVQRYRGSPAPIRAIGWSSKERTINAKLLDGRTVTWLADLATTVRSEPGRWYTAAAPVPGTDTVAVLSRDGRVDVIDAGNWKILRGWDMGPGPSMRLAVSASASIAVLSPGSPGVVALLHAGKSSVVVRDLPACDASDIAFSSDERSLLVACSQGVGVLDLQSWGIRITPDPMHWAVTSVAAAGDRIVAGTRSGALLQMQADGAISRSEARGVKCIGSMTHLAVLPDNSTVMNSGAGVGSSDCASTFELHDTGVSETLQLIGNEVRGGAASEAIAASPDGKYFARGYSDGSVRVCRADTEATSAILHGSMGSVRGIAFAGNSQELVVVTRDGDLRLYEPRLWSRTPTELAAAVAEKVDDAIEMEIYKRATFNW